MQILDGKKTAKELQLDIKKQVEELSSKGITPGLASIIVGEDPASKVYVRNKERLAEKLGIRSFRATLPEDTTEDELLAEINKLNEHSEVDGIIIQLPLPKHIDEKKVIKAIDPQKDVDCFHPETVGNMFLDASGFIPCTPSGAMRLLKAYNIPMKGKHAVVVGRSNIVGKPLAQLLLNENATVTIVHSKTENIAEYTKNADILAVAIGRPNFITKDMVKQGATVVDIGINQVDDKLVGDVDYEAVSPITSWITPVPGGVGPMTNTVLMSNTIEACIQRRRNEN